MASTLKRKTRSAPSVSNIRKLLQLKNAHVFPKAELKVRAGDSATLTSILGLVAHELRNPLHGISIGLRAIESRPQGSDAARMRELMRHHIEHAQRLVSDLLDMSGSGASLLACDFAPTSLLQVVTRSLSACAERIRGKGQILKVSTPPRDCEFVADGQRLNQVLSNFLDNAMKFTPSNGTIRVTAISRSRDIWLAVSDSGLGLTLKQMQRLGRPFEPIVQGHSRHCSGLGLGLFVARAIIEAHRGKMIVSSNGPGKGTTFAVQLPKAVATK